MRRFVLDASVIAKWFIDEEDTDRALAIRSLYAEGKIGLLLPILVLYELGNVLVKHPSTGVEDTKLALQALLDLQIKLGSPVETELLENIVRISKEHHVTFYDATYVSLSEWHGIGFITADRKLYEKIRSRFRVLLLSEIDVGTLP